jgi:hypothetical protein
VLCGEILLENGIRFYEVSYKVSGGGAVHSRQAKNMGGWYMREISIYKLQIPNKLQKANPNIQ